jgi:hypothetical protein
MHGLHVSLGIMGEDAVLLKPLYGSRTLLDSPRTRTAAWLGREEHRDGTPVLGTLLRAFYSESTYDNPASGSHAGALCPASHPRAAFPVLHRMGCWAAVDPRVTGEQDILLADASLFKVRTSQAGRPQMANNVRGRCRAVGLSGCRAVGLSGSFASSQLGGAAAGKLRTIIWLRLKHYCMGSGVTCGFCGFARLPPAMRSISSPLFEGLGFCRGTTACSKHRSIHIVLWRVHRNELTPVRSCCARCAPGAAGPPPLHCS